MRSIAVIGTANLCRSVMAHAIFVAELERRSLPVEACSGGVSDFESVAPVGDAIMTCLRNGAPLPKLEATFAGNLDLSSAVRVFVMEPFHRTELAALHPNLSAPVALLGEFDPLERGATIKDPIGRGRLEFDRCYSRLRDCIVHYLDTTRDLDGVAG